MKLAQALSDRANLQTRIEVLRERLVANAKVQEGEAPAEDPAELMAQLEDCTTALETLITRINLTNAATLADGETLTAKLARRDCLGAGLRCCGRLPPRPVPPLCAAPVPNQNQEHLAGGAATKNKLMPWPSSCGNWMPTSRS